MHLVILSLALTVNGGRRIFFPATTLVPSLSVTPNIAAAHLAFGLIRSLFSRESDGGAKAPLDSGA